MAEVDFPARVMFRFVETLSADSGHDTLSAVLSKSGLPGEWAHATYFAGLDNVRSARAYAQLQSALRLYYGRGARGILFRVGSKLWDRLLDDSSFGVKAQAAVIRRLPKAMRQKSALELLARMLSATPGNVTAHAQDRDLLLVDRAASATLDQTEGSPICFVTLGLVRECLFWADGQEHDIEEIACRAAGAKQCEFKVIVGGQP